LVGALFVVSGGEKLLSPYQNFLYIIEQYQIVHGLVAEMAARILPWIEFFLGIFLLLGLWLNIALRGMLGLIAFFIVMLAQAMIRHLPLDECGCFGSLISFPLPVTLSLDIFLLVLTFVLLRRMKDTRLLSLDHWYHKM
jgi:hypothetical protein